MKPAVVKHVEENCVGGGCYELYHFEIHLLGSAPPILFDCPAREAVYAWLQAAEQSCRYNMPCMSIVYKGKNRE